MIYQHALIDDRLTDVSVTETDREQRDTWPLPCGCLQLVISYHRHSALRSATQQQVDIPQKKNTKKRAAWEKEKKISVHRSHKKFM